MPIYEYLCPNCKVKFELLRPLSQSSEVASCPRCHTDAKRMFSPSLLFLKAPEGHPLRLTGALLVAHVLP
jgi:putative FmdB family regulatory protein